MSPINMHEEDNGDLSFQYLTPHGGDLAEDIANFCNEGFNVDYNNEPSPENIPTDEEPPLSIQVIKSDNAEDGMVSTIIQL